MLDLDEVLLLEESVEETDGNADGLSRRPPPDDETPELYEFELWIAIIGWQTMSEKCAIAYVENAFRHAMLQQWDK